MQGLIIRECVKEDLDDLLQLYTQLHDNLKPSVTDDLLNLWNRILEDTNYHLIVGCVDEKIVSSCTLIVIPNLTHQRRPYALIENVITDEKLRGKGFASEVLHYAKEIAQKNNCYKIMLLTGSKNESTLAFYERAGYNRKDKTAFIMWLK